MQSILILDDDYTFRGLVRDLLKSKGLAVIEATSGQEASAAIARDKPILAIVDYKLPDTDGLSWITKLRESGNNCPLVFVSQTWCDPKTFNWLRNILKATLILQKPIVPELFLQQIETLLPSTILQQLIDAQSSKLERQQKIEQAKTDYARGLAQTWSELSKAISLVQQDPTNSAAKDAAIQWAHKIAGSAGSLGFKRVGEAAAIIQNLLRTLDPSDTMQKIVWSEIFRMLAEGETSVRNSVRLCETLQGKESLAASRILVIGKKGYYQTNIHKLQTTTPVIIELCETLPAASQRVRSYKFDAVIFDLSLDENSKIFQLAKEIRLLPGYESLPFGFVSKSVLGSMSTSLKTPIQVDFIYAGCSILLSEVPGKSEIERTCNKLLSYRQANQPRILTVDDDEMLTKFIASILAEEGMLVSALNKPIEIMETLEQFQPDIVLLDVLMPGLSGYDLCRQLRSSEKWKDLPVIFLTSKNDQAGRAAAFHAGGKDFLSKPILAEELILRVKSQLDFAKKQEKLSKPEHQAGILDGERFISTIETLIGNIGNNSTTSLVLLSIDELTNISFNHGIAAAQEVLLSLKNLIQCRFRSEDLKGYLGENMFAIVFLGEQEAIISKVMDKLQEEFSNITFISGNGSHFRATFSVGLVEYPLDGANLNMLLDLANQRHLTNRKQKPGAAAFVS